MGHPVYTPQIKLQFEQIDQLLLLQPWRSYIFTCEFVNTQDWLLFAELRSYRTMNVLCVFVALEIMS